MAAGGPACAHLEETAVIDFTDEDLSRIELHLRMATQTEMSIPLDEHLLVHGTVRLVACGAAVLHALMNEDEGSSLFAVALGALLVLTGQAQTAGLFENLSTVRIVTRDAVHLPFKNGMMLGEAELGMFLLMAVQAGLGIGTGIVDKDAFPAACLDVFAAGTVA